MPTFNPAGGNIYPNSTVTVTISTTTSGAQIRYTLDGTTPTSTYGTLINGSSGHTSSFNPGTAGKTLTAIAFESGYTDSDVHSDNYWYASGQAPQFSSSSSSSQTIIFSVWDGDWAILEEYGPSNVLIESYVQGYHGLVKTIVSNIYYYQDELGSTSHIADVHGALLEYYKYDLYGKPTFFSSTSQPLNSSAFAVKDLFTGQRWVVEIGLYDDRNRFMSPDLGRFLQPDPIGFKGDGSNLYRYCGNDWANKSDPMGLFGDQQADRANMQREQHDQHMDGSQQIEAMELRNTAYAPTAGKVERSGGNMTYAMPGGGWGVPRSQGFTMGQVNQVPRDPKYGVQVAGGMPKEHQSMQKKTNNVLATPRGQQLQAQEIRQHQLVTLHVFHAPPGGNGSFTLPNFRDIYIDPNYHPLINTKQGPVPASTERNIAHELGHAITHDSPSDYIEHVLGNMDNINHNENPIMRSLGQLERTDPY